MSFFYSCFFVSTWLVGLLGLLALLPLAVWLAIDTLTDPNGRFNVLLIICLAVVLVLAVFGAFTRLYTNAKHLIRAGVFWEGILFSDRFPTTEEELVELAIRAYKGAGGSLTTVSHGWSFYLQKEAAQGPRVWTTRFRGPVDEGEFIPRVWRAGTALAEVKKNFKAVARTMLDTPSMEYLSLASWVVSASHGHPGTLSPSSSPLHWVRRARVLDCETRQISDDNEAMLYAKFHSATSKKSRYVILTVEIKPEAIVEDVTVERFATRIDSPDRLEAWLRGKHIRLMFVSRHRRSLGVTWTSPENGVVNVTKTKHMHPHCCSRFSFHCHADVDSAHPCNCWDFGERLIAYAGYAKLSDAYTGINPDFLPFQTMLAQILTVYNEELFCPLSASQAGNVQWLFELIIKLEDHLYLNGGRVELRVSADNRILFLDLSTRNLDSTRDFFKLLHRHGIDAAAQHPGKYVCETILPIREVPVAAVYRPLGLESV